MLRSATKPAALAVALVYLSLITAGCASLAKGADSILVRAEQTERIGFGVVDTFVRLERRDIAFRAAVGADGHAAAEKLRTEFPGVIRAFREAQQVYRDNRTAANGASLETILKLVEKALTDAQFFMNKWGA